MSGGWHVAPICARPSTLSRSIKLGYLTAQFSVSRLFNRTMLVGDLFELMNGHEWPASSKTTLRALAESDVIIAALSRWISPGGIERGEGCRQMFERSI